MVAKKKVPLPSRPLDVSEDAWTEAVRREETVRKLANTATSSKAAVQSAAKNLGLSASQCLSENFSLHYNGLCERTEGLVIGK